MRINHETHSAYIVFGMDCCCVFSCWVDRKGKVSRILLLILFLVGCNKVEYKPYYQDVIVAGDSLCKATHGGIAWPKIAGIAYDCVGGRPATRLNEMPTGYRLIIFSLGRNDVNQSTTEEYDAQLEYLFSTTDSEIWCILPDMPEIQLPNDKLEEIRLVMFEHCPKTIEPKDHGYLFRAPDKIHGSPEDHHNLGMAIRSMIEAGDI